MFPVNYPDVLGYITGGTRQNLGVVQAAATTHPAQINAGRPFEIIVLLQNITAARVEVALIPGQKNWLALAKEQVRAVLEPGEVGILSIGAKIHPKTPEGQQSLPLDIQTRAADPKAAVIREADGGGKFTVDTLSEVRRKLIDGLQKLPFNARKRGLLRASGLEVEITVKAAGDAPAVKPRTGWRSLWTMADMDDLAPLVEQYAELITLRVLPKLTRQQLYEPLRTQVIALFEGAGYPLQPLEVEAITRLMLLVLEYANAPHNGHSSLQAGMYDISGKMAQGAAHSLPRWVQTLLRTITRDPRAVQAPVKFIPLMAHDALLYDAMMLGFQLVDDATGDPLGTPEEMTAYADKLLNKIARQQALTFGDVYMPLVTAGIIAYEYVLLPEEKLSAVLNEMIDLLEQRQNELNDENELIFEIADQILTQSLRKYGTLDSRNL